MLRCSITPILGRMNIPVNIINGRSLPGWRDLWCDLVSGLDDEGRRLRFFSASREGARQFCRSARPEKLLFAASGGIILGATDVHLVRNTIEVGICVGKEFRGHGVGGALVDAVLHDPPEGAERCVLHYLRENAAIGRICAARGAVTRVEEGVIRAEIGIERRSPVSVIRKEDAGVRQPLLEALSPASAFRHAG